MKSDTSTTALMRPMVANAAISILVNGMDRGKFNVAPGRAAKIAALTIGIALSDENLARMTTAAAAPDQAKEALNAEIKELHEVMQKELHEAQQKEVELAESILKNASLF